MVRGWFLVRVELVAGMGRKLKHPPGRIMLVGPNHTLRDLAEAIDAAFARWDLSHLHEFHMPDGKLYGYPDPDYPEYECIDSSTVRAGRLVRRGDRFAYIYDLGDEWKHLCRVGASSVDPVEAFGVVPEKPVPIWGWGWIPDQYGRRWDGDTGEDDEAEEWVPSWK